MVLVPEAAATEKTRLVLRHDVLQHGSLTRNVPLIPLQRSIANMVTSSHVQANYEPVSEVQRLLLRRCDDPQKAYDHVHSEDDQCCIHKPERSIRW